MYTDVRKRHWPAVAAAFFAAFLLLTEEGAEAIREAVRRSALQCYVVEGVYPPDLEYLEDHYGLRVNTEDYYVIYDIFASNQPPDIRVTKRG